LKLFSNGSLVKEYPVAVGKPTSKSPLGSFVIRNKVINPYWNNKGNTVAPGPKNPLGIRWMGISAPRGTYGIHGNNIPSSIGTFASGGCIRMYNNDVEELYATVSLTTPVQIIYENIEIKQDKYNNSSVLLVYPDIYKQKKAEGILKKLIISNPNITQAQVEKALKLAGGNISSTVAVSENTAVMLNNQFATNDAIIENNQVYIYYMAAIDIFGVNDNIITDGSIPILEKDNKVYVNLSQIVAAAGGKLKIDSNNNNVFVSLNLVKVNGRYLSSYKGDFDKEYMLESKSFSELKNNVADNSKEILSLKELCKQQDWQLNTDSLNKVIDIKVPLRVKIGDLYINTTAYKDRYYINSEDASTIPEIQTQNLNLYSYKDKSYYDLYEIMDIYECQKDDFFTIIEVFKIMNSEV
jgi:hypothetical protein